MRATALSTGIGIDYGSLSLCVQQTIRRPVRSLLTLASNCVGRGIDCGRLIGTSSARTAYQEMSASPNGVAQYELVSNTNEPVDLTKLDKVYELDELKTVQAVVLGQGRFAMKANAWPHLSLVLYQ